MDKKIKKIMDNLDYDEAQSLLEEIDVKNMDSDTDEGKILNYDRIAGMVYEKTGVKKKKVVNFRKYASMAAVAAVGFLIGLATMSIGINISNNNNGDGESPVNVAEVDNNDDKFSPSDETTGTIGSEDTNDDKPAKEDNDKDKAPDKKNPSKGDKDTGHKNNDKQPDGEIKAGDNTKADEIESMPLKDIEKILSNATSEIDMECFVAKYADIDTMVEDCDYVLKGTKTDSRFRAADEKDEYDLYADFRVESVLVNNTDKEIKENILVQEGIIYGRNEDEEKITHLAGYRCMEMKKDYILFVKKKSDKTYRIAGIVYGKVPVDADEDVIEVDSVYEDNAHIVKLKAMINDVRDRYLDKAPEKSEEPVESEEPKAPEKTDEADSDTNNYCNTDNNSDC